MAIGDSLGQGIALGGVLPPQDTSFLKDSLKDLRGQRDYLKIKNDKRREADEAKYQDMMTNIDTAGIDPHFKSDVNLEVAKFMDIARQKKSDNRYGNWMNDSEIQDNFYKLRNTIDEARQATAALNKDFAEQRANPQDYNLNSDVYGSYQTNPSEKKFITNQQNNYGNRFYTPGTILQRIVPVEKQVDIIAELKKVASPTMSKASKEKPAGDYLVTKGGEYFDVALNQLQAKNIIEDPTSVVGNAILRSTGGDAEKAKDKIYNILKGQAGVSDKESLAAIPKGKGLEFNFNDGKAANDSYTAVYDIKQTPRFSYPENKPIAPKQNERIRIQRNDRAENAPLKFPDPTAPDTNDKIKATPIEFVRHDDGDWFLLVSRTDRKSGRDVEKEFEIPVADAMPDFQSAYGFTLNDLLAGGIAGKKGNFASVPADTNTQVNSVPAQSDYTNMTVLQRGGKSVQAGVKNGKWYDTATGEELK